MINIFFDGSISLDGFFAGDNRSPDNPMGGVSPKIHSWMFKQKAFWKHNNMEGGEEYGADSKLIEDVFARTGSCIMGKRMFEEGEANWPEDLFKSDVYVLTHEKRDPWVQKGTTTFYFINDGIISALQKAIQTSKGKDVQIMGGADTIQQYLNSGFVDEFTLHITPVILGSGIRLFDNIDMNKFDIEVIKVIPSSLTTHLHYRLNKRSDK